MNTFTDAIDQTVTTIEEVVVVVVTLAIILTVVWFWAKTRQG